MLDEFGKGGVTLGRPPSPHSLFSSRPLRLALSGDVPLSHDVISVSDLTLLPRDLAEQSLSTRDILLPLAEAERAIEHLRKSGHRLESWEGWVKFADGTRTKSLRHPGSFVLPMDGARAAVVTLESIRKAQETWSRAPEYPGATLYFGLVVAPA